MTVFFSFPSSDKVPGQNLGILMSVVYSRNDPSRLTSILSVNGFLVLDGWRRTSLQSVQRPANSGSSSDQRVHALKRSAAPKCEVSYRTTTGWRPL